MRQFTDNFLEAGVLTTSSNRSELGNLNCFNFRTGKITA